MSGNLVGRFSRVTSDVTAIIHVGQNAANSVYLKLPLPDQTFQKFKVSKSVLLANFMQLRNVGFANFEPKMLRNVWLGVGSIFQDGEGRSYLLLRRQIPSQIQLAWAESKCRAIVKNCWYSLQKRTNWFELMNTSTSGQMIKKSCCWLCHASEWPLWRAQSNSRK